MNLVTRFLSTVAAITVFATPVFASQPMSDQEMQAQLGATTKVLHSQCTAGRTCTGDAACVKAMGGNQAVNQCAERKNANQTTVLGYYKDVPVEYNGCPAPNAAVGSACQENTPLAICMNRVSYAVPDAWYVGPCNDRNKQGTAAICWHEKCVLGN
jgi:hypothetical protein